MIFRNAKRGYYKQLLIIMAKSWYKLTTTYLYMQQKYNGKQISGWLLWTNYANPLQLLIAKLENIKLVLGSCGFFIKLNARLRIHAILKSSLPTPTPPTFQFYHTKYALCLHITMDTTIWRTLSILHHDHRSFMFAFLSSTSDDETWPLSESSYNVLLRFSQCDSVHLTPKKRIIKWNKWWIVPFYCYCP